MKPHSSALRCVEKTYLADCATLHRLKSNVFQCQWSFKQFLQQKVSPVLVNLIKNIQGSSYVAALWLRSVRTTTIIIIIQNHNSPHKNPTKTKINNKKTTNTQPPQKTPKQQQPKNPTKKHQNQPKTKLTKQLKPKYLHWQKKNQPVEQKATVKTKNQPTKNRKRLTYIWIFLLS